MKIRNVLWGFIVGCFLGANLALAGTTTRVSVSSEGEEARSSGECENCGGQVIVDIQCRVGSGVGAISADGRSVGFTSWAENLVPDDTIGSLDVFVHDRRTGETTRVSVDSQGNPAEGTGNVCGDNTSGPALSGDGRLVTFATVATNLVPDDTNGVEDVFVHDRETGETTRVSVNSLGEEASAQSGSPAISGDGRFVTFQSRAANLVPDDTNDSWDVFVHDRETNETTRVSVSSFGEEANGSSESPTLSGDGRFVAFESDATNLVPDDTNEEWGSDVFVHDREANETTRVSVSSFGEEANGMSKSPTLSGDGRFVAFESDATNLVPDDTNGRWDVFVHNRQTNETIRVSVNSLGEEANRRAGGGALNGDGRFVAFESDATNLVPDDNNENGDVFVHDRQTDQTTRVSVNSLGEQGNSGAGGGALNGDGRFVAFDSGASNLIPDDTNGQEDVFVRDEHRTIVNERVTLEPLTTTFQTQRNGNECGDDFLARFLFDGLLVNQSGAGLANLQIPVTELTRGNRLLTDMGLIGPNGEFPVPERDEYADGILGPGESVTIPFEVCLRERKSFQLYVDVAEDRGNDN